MTDSVRDRVIAACHAKPGSVEDYPFGDEVAVFKVAGKMFALVALGPAPGSVSLKCDPDLAVGLRRRRAGITAGYHLSKRHWNTVTLDGSVPDDEVLGLIGHAWDLVVVHLAKAGPGRRPAAARSTSSSCPRRRRSGTGPGPSRARPT